MRAAFVLGMMALADAVRAAAGMESAGMTRSAATAWLVVILILWGMDIADLCTKILKRGE